MAYKRINNKNGRSAYRHIGKCGKSIRNHDPIPPNPPTNPSREWKKHTDKIIEKNRGAWEKLAEE